MHPHEELESIISTVNLILCVSGYEVLSESWSVGIKSKVKRFCATLLMAMTPIATTTAFYYHFNNFVELSEALMIAAGCYQNLFKLIALQYVYQDIIVLVTEFRTFRAKYPGDIEEDKQYKDTIFIKRPIWSMVTMISCYWITLTLLFTSPIFKSERSLPFAYYLPLGPPLEQPYYVVNYVFIVLTVVVCMHLTVGLDAIFILLVSEVCLQINVMKHKVTQLGESKEERHMQFREIYEMHTNIIRVIKIINKTFSKILLVQFSSSFLLISTSLFMATNNNSKMLTFALSVMLQLCLYCFYGEILKNKISEFSFDLYNNKWYDLNIEDQRSVLLSMTYAQVDLTLKASGMTELSLETYLQILKTAYSYYAVMRDTQRK